MGVGLGQSASPPNGGQTSGPTLTARQAFCHQAHIVGPKRIDQSPTPFADANIGAIPETLKAREESHQQQTQQQPPPQLLLKGQAANDIIDVPRHVAATLGRHSGGTFGSWPALPT
ncbi:TPA: hypothetical protein ACH3X3_002511 [Trebouxia sp. C0006]